ncbi:alpha/beta hydrolase [Novosphingobium huizhouense]|uniref:alpha/beta hydrolase n=1 Tax=Novosphingobium huizhouense TaxID=2866625 RepID=UPI001CD81BE1|nr:alpha/beta hydrolase [Novosphingobium huizhouense]
MAILQIGWLGWTAVTLLLLAVLGFVALRHAMETNAVAVLDSADKLLRGGDGAIRQVAAERYGDDASQKVEMFVPADARAPLPIVVFIPGGSWRSGDPHDYRFIARALAPRGYAVVLAGYRLGPKGRFPAMLEDGASALRWVADHARARGGDPDRIVLMGHSAGAYNAAMLALDRRWLAHRRLSADALRGMIGLSGPYDFYPFDDPATIDAFGHAANPEDTQPIAHVRGDAPPLLLVHGSTDTRVRPRNSVALARALTAAGAPTHAVLLKDVSHEGMIMAFARPFSRDPRALDAVTGFLAQVTRPGPSPAASSAASPAVQAPGR